MSKTEQLLFEILNIIENSIWKWVYWVILEKNINFELSKLVIKVRSYTIVVFIQKSKNKILVSDIVF